VAFKITSVYTEIGAASDGRLCGVACKRAIRDGRQTGAMRRACAQWPCNVATDRRAATSDYRVVLYTRTSRAASKSPRETDPSHHGPSDRPFRPLFRPLVAARWFRWRELMAAS